MIPATSSILYQILTDEGLGTDPSKGLDFPVYINITPDAPELKPILLTVYDTTDIKKGRINRSGEVVSNLGGMVQCRAFNQVEGRKQMIKIQEALDKYFDKILSIDGENIIVNSIQRSGGINYLGMEGDTSRRALFSLNILVSITQQQTT